MSASPNAAPQPELNGDQRLGTGDRVRYLWRNFWRNLRASGGARSEPFRPGSVTAAEIGARSPSRFLTERFLAQELPRLVPPREIAMLEIGCGSGSMMRRLAGLGYSGSYVGVDIGDRFDRAHGTPFAAAFVQSDAHLYQPAAPVDLLFSFSALEHIGDDKALVARLSRSVKPGGSQIHIVPAAAGLFVYLLHGYRQYTPADLVARFGPDIRVIRLGGAGTFVVHMTTIAVPENILGLRLRSRFPNAYARLVQAGIALDRLLPVWPTALVVFKQH